MNNILLILLILLTGCTKEDIIPPCPHRIEVQGDKVQVWIVSDLPEVEVCISGRCSTINEHYYNCIYLSLRPGDNMIEFIAEEQTFIKLP